MENNGDNNICSVDDYCKDIDHNHHHVIKDLQIH
jgi:hypothetical protein